MILPKLKTIEKFALDNSPTILTVIGVVGTIGTAVLTHKAATKVQQKSSGQTPVEFKLYMEENWKFYIPPVISGTVTVGCIVMANRIGSKRAAAIAAAYTISEKAYTEYRDKVVERIGANEERKIRDDVVRDRIRNNPQDESNVVLVGSGNVLCYDMYTGRYFDSAVEEIKKARNETNFQLNSDGFASVSDFYQRIGLPNTSISDQIGWTADVQMDLDFTTVMSEDGRPCVAINFNPTPNMDYRQFH